MGSGGISAFVRVDVVWQKIAPVVVRHAFDVSLRTVRDSRPSTDRADVVGFAVVVPSENLRLLANLAHLWKVTLAYLDHFGLEFDDLLPSIVPQIVTPKQPVLVPLRYVRVEPWGNSHHVRFTLQDSLPCFVVTGGLGFRTMWPHVPGEMPVDFLEGEESLSVGPRRHEEAPGRLLDGRPVFMLAVASESRDQWLPIVSEL